MARLNLPRQRIIQGPAVVWKRIVAFMIDLFIIDFILFWPFERIFSRVIPESSRGISSLQQFFSASPGLASALTMTSVVMGIIVVLYFALLEYYVGQTPGKMLFSIRVISSADGVKKEMRFWQCLVRSILWIPMFPFIVFWIIDPLYVLLNQQNQRLLELVSRTSTMQDYRGI